MYKLEISDKEKECDSNHDEYKKAIQLKDLLNSLYGGNGAKTSSFYEQDCAASTTATGRKLLTYAKRVIEEAYSERIVEAQGEKVRIRAEYVYGDTESV